MLRKEVIKAAGDIWVKEVLKGYLWPFAFKSDRDDLPDNEIGLLDVV